MVVGGSSCYLVSAVSSHDCLWSGASLQLWGSHCTVMPTEVENQPTIQPEPGWLLSRDWMITSELE